MSRVAATTGAGCSGSATHPTARPFGLGFGFGFGFGLGLGVANLTLTLTLTPILTLILTLTLTLTLALTLAVTQAVVSEVWDETLEEDIVAGFGGYERLRAEDTFGITTQGKETSAWLSMLRKLHLANELRRVRVRNPRVRDRD